MDVSPVDMVRIRHAIEDHAGRWYGQVGPFVFGRWDCARYLTEGVLSKLGQDRGWDWSELWDFVDGYLAEHPQVMQVRYTDEQIRQREQARTDAARALERQALAAFRAGEFSRALELLDRAELVAPDGLPHPSGGRLVSWDARRQAVHRRMSAGVGAG